MKHPLEETEGSAASLRPLPQPSPSMDLPDSEEGGDSASAEKAWAEEIRSRVEEYREGRVQPVPSDMVFARLRDQLR